MDKRRKISDPDIRQIFKSSEPAPVLGKRFGISEQMIYLIRSGRVHARITQGIQKAPARQAAASNVDTIALADAIIDRLIARLHSHSKVTRPKRSARRSAAVSPNT